MANPSDLKRQPRQEVSGLGLRDEVLPAPPRPWRDPWWYRWRLFAPALGTAVVCGTAAAIAWAGELIPLWNAAPRLAIIFYGAGLTLAIGLLRLFARRGEMWRHLLAIALVWVWGLVYTKIYAPVVHTLGMGWLGPFENYFQHWLIENLWILAPFSGALGLPQTVWPELLNMTQLLVYVLLVVVLVLPGGKFDKTADMQRRGAFIWPSLHNATIAASLGWVAILFTVMMLIWAVLNATMEDQSWWHKHAVGFAWFAPVAAIYHLAVLAQRRLDWAYQPVTAVGRAPLARAPSVKPIYQRLIAEVGAPILAHHGEKEGGGGALADHAPYLRFLQAGGTVLKTGSADREFYRLFSTAVIQAQVKGEAVLVVCPDGAGPDIRRTLGSLSRVISAEVLQRWAWLDSSGDAFSENELFDLVLVEESKFHDRLVPDARAFVNHLRRTRLIVLIDFHVLDACRFMTAREILRATEGGGGLTKAGELVLARARRGLDDQLTMIFETPNRRIETFVTAPAPAKVYRLFWNDGPQLRAKLAGLTATPDRFDSAPLLGLTGETEGRFIPATAVFDCAPGFQRDFGDLKNHLVEANRADDSARAERAALRTHHVPPPDSRITIVRDPGNLADVAEDGFDFFRSAAAGDRLVHVLSLPYPAREFAYHLLATNPAEFRSRTMPFAQKPGIGFMELALNVETALRGADGLGERALATLLRQVSGNLRKDLKINATRTGILKLFRIIQPDFAPRAIKADYSGGRMQVFRMSLSANEGSIGQRFDVRTEAGEAVGTLAYRDEGLTYFNNSHVRLGGESYRVENIDEQAQQIQVTHAGHDPAFRFQRAVFKRSYEITLGDKAAREHEESRDCQDGSLLTRSHIHATIVRHSSGYADWKGDEPLLMAADFHPKPVEKRHRRPYRGVYLLTLRGPIDNHGPLMSSAVRHTLSASLNDVLSLVFPGLAHRIAAVELNADAHFTWPSQYARLAFRYPTGTVAAGGTVAETVQAVFRRGGERPEPQCFSEGWGGVDLAVIEDADSDLGVVRRLHDNWEKREGFEQTWRLYLEWAATQELWQPKAGVFDAPAALELGLFQGH